MRQSTLFTKTRREDPAYEESVNARLLIRAGFVHKEMAGVYTLLPLGLRVFNKIIGIIREEMNAIGGQEMLMTTLQDPELWKKSNRWVEEGEKNPNGLPWFKTKLVNGNELGIANTHEETLTNILCQHVSSYRDLPLYAYQFQNKFRNELRAKSGIMRAREFVMKDLYSFSKTEEQFREFYEECAKAYLRVFDRLGLGNRTYRTFASGGAFSKFSDEFQTLSEAGEDTIYILKEKNLAINKEVFTDEVLSDMKVRREDFEEHKSIEVGNIFPLGTKYSQALGLLYRTEDGEDKPVIMGSYGIGVGRAMGTIVEALHDEKGIVWPSSVAPFAVHLVALQGGEEEAEKLYKRLKEQGTEVLYDDRIDVAPGAKFADSDLLGIPARVVVSTKTVADKQAEVKKRTSETLERVSLENMPKFFF
ncbi:MAG: aminoacyl--tRNA ligase-related protein [bacterium]|nr:aminoacyl--tRNA ligase-related protein [bacterium]